MSGLLDSELGRALLAFASACGAGDITKLDINWEGETSRYRVVLNGSKETRDNVPGFGCAVYEGDELRALLTLFNGVIYAPPAADMRQREKALTDHFTIAAQAKEAPDGR